MTTQDAAPVADQPIRPTCFHWLKNDKDDYGFALKDGRYALYPADMKLYSAPPDSLAVAQALEAAAKVCFDYMQGECSCDTCNTARLLEARIRALIPADIAAKAQRQAEDAERYREARRNPGGYVHLLSLMLRDNSDSVALDKMMDRIAESRRNAARGAKWT